MPQSLRSRAEASLLSRLTATAQKGLQRRRRSRTDCATCCAKDWIEENSLNLTPEQLEEDDRLILGLVDSNPKNETIEADFTPDPEIKEIEAEPVLLEK